MREFRLRGKTKVQRGMLPIGSWIEGGYYKDDAYGGTPTVYVLTWNSSGPGGYMDPIKVDPATVGQFTGFKDKNGREICEGDIVRYTSKEQTGTRVQYKRRGYDSFAVYSDVEIIGVVKSGTHDDLITFIVDTDQTTKYESYFWGEGKRTDRPRIVTHSLVKPLKINREYEVIGNIHDNPELLEAK